MSFQASPVCVVFPGKARSSTQVSRKYQTRLEMPAGDKHFLGGGVGGIYQTSYELLKFIIRLTFDKNGYP